MSDELKGKKVAFLATNGFEYSELTQPWDEIKAAGADVELISLESGKIQGESAGEPTGDPKPVDRTVDQISAGDYNALVLPGGLANPDTLRTNDRAVSFVRDFFAQHKPVGAICHAPWVLIEAGVVDGRTLTSFPSVQTDLKNAGATWVDREVVCDEALVTSRTPDDLDAFCAKMIEEIAEGKHEEQTT